MNNLKSLTVKLHCLTHTSDKLYKIEMQQSIQPDKWHLIASYGKRGHYQKSVFKTVQPQTYSIVVDMFHRLQYEKEKKGYVELI